MGFLSFGARALVPTQISCTFFPHKGFFLAGFFLPSVQTAFDLLAVAQLKVYDVSLFWGVAQCVLFIFIVKCNDGAVVPQPNWYQD